MTAVLETRALRKTFGGLVATNTVDFTLPVGARHALIGPNGAGKTTFVNLLSGVLRPTSGEILLKGQPITHWPVHTRAMAGLTRTFQINQLFVDLTPLQTIVLALSQSAQAPVGMWKPFGSQSARVDEAAALLTRLGLGDALDRRVGSLPYGRQRMLEIAVALAGNPDVLLLDEPAAGVPDGEREQILDVIAALPDAVALVLIDHDMELVFRFAKSISVLVSGGMFAQGTPAEIAADPRVREAYLGEAGAPGHDGAARG